MESEIIFYLNISAEEYLRYYQGNVHMVQVYSVDGRKIRFPANRLVPFVAREGIQGRFSIRFDKMHRFVSMQRIA